MIQQKHLSSSDGSDDDDDEVEDLDKNKLIAQKKDKQSRTSVSAEAYGQFNKKSAFKAKVVKKTPEQLQRIRQKLAQAFMFASLEESDLKIVIDAMEEKKFKAGDPVIQQGEDGEVLYVVDQGELDCFKVFKKGEQPKYLKTYKPGESFGELALLYNAPRAATIKGKTDSILFSLDRETFNHIVKDSASKKRVYYEEFLSKVDLLSEMDPYERLQIADALRSQKFKKGDTIIKQGDQGTTFYLLQQGECVATKTSQQGIKSKAPELVFKYKAGDYFGELALLKNEPRAANIVAENDVIVVYLDSASFRRLCGPIEEILKRNTAKYAKFVQQAK